MKKRIIALVAIVCAMTLLLCACGGGGGNNGGGGAGETVENDLLSATCPKGWMFYQPTDIFAETDADGNHPADPTQMMFVKDGKSEWDLFSKPVVSVTYNDSELTDDTLTWTAYFLTDPVEISVTVDGVECRALTGRSLVDEENPDTDYWEYVYIFKPVEAGGYIQFSVPLHCGEDDGVKLEDADVSAILTSVKLK